ncbi:related to F1F0-ATPase complex assembly protein ATP11 [Cephalotrichum gorgonifer]|uniref:Related to F1F0-ATPase complex assembly protein ATP11 n=1 Tax=Cephalotrichum gorgonifer TaxID=2041049 RepID=A0AAE8MQC3_9PEZI|nr:related to F1F0-ATPase complex assembly protein ATP11 [Cephalotrichum gorgonifer]
MANSILFSPVAVRRLLGPATRTLRAASHQRRWAQVHDIRLLTTGEHPQRVIERYRAKLDQKAKEAGVETIEDLKTAFSDKIADLRRKDAVEDPLAAYNSGSNGVIPEPQIQDGSTTTQQTPVSKAARSASGTPGVKPLSSFLDLEKARSLPEKELTAIWRLRHANSPLSLCAAIPRSVYAAMETAARSAPQFVLPVPHPEQGAEIHFVEWAFDAETRTTTVLFTQLAEYKARGEFAQPHTSITHHSDLAEESGLVLMEGQVVEGRGAKIEDARFLVLSLQKFYGGWGEGGEARQLLEWFSKGDSRFTIEKLLEEAERLA